jgi:hypothetical protein
MHLFRLSIMPVVYYKIRQVQNSAPASTRRHTARDKPPTDLHQHHQVAPPPSTLHPANTPNKENASQLSRIAEPYRPLIPQGLQSFLDYFGVLIGGVVLQRVEFKLLVIADGAHGAVEVVVLGVGADHCLLK